MEHTGLQTEGRNLLLEWLAVPTDPPRSQSSLARELRINQSAVSQWARGLSRPEAHYREALETLCGIPARSWQTIAEQAVVTAIRVGRDPTASDFQGPVATGTGG